MLALERVFLRLGEEPVEILRDISVQFEKGKFYVITGPNGGGKTSVAKMIMGIYTPWSGKILYQGEDITGLSISERARLGIRYAFQNPPRFKGIDIFWFLRMAAPELTEHEIRVMLRKIGLCPEDYFERIADNGLSGGEMKRLEIASVLLAPTKVAVLDEPEAGVDLWGFEQMLNLVIESHAATKDRTTILISHSEKFLQVADEIIILANGQIQTRGNYASIRSLLEQGTRCWWRKACLEGDEINAAQCNG